MSNMKMNDDQMIFLISLPRSGSTMLQKILGKHKDIYTRSEPWLMIHPMYAMKTEGITARYNSVVAAHGVQDFVAYLPANGLDLYYSKIRECYLSLYEAYLHANKKTYFLDKTPRYYEVFDELQETFPNAKFIILYRNPLAVFVSILDTWINGRWTKLKEYEGDLKKGIKFLTRDFASYSNVYTIKYEELLANPEKNVRSIFNFLELEYQEGCINYGQSNEEDWLYGDPKTVYEKNSPDSEHINKWQTSLENPEILKLTNEYFDYIGKNQFEKLGYDYEATRKILTEVPKKIGAKEFPNFTLDEYLINEEQYRIRIENKNKSDQKKINDLIKEIKDLNLLNEEKKQNIINLEEQIDISKNDVKLIETKLEITEKKLSLQSQALSELKNKFDKISKISFYFHPFKKLRSYRSLLQTYSNVYQYLSILSNDHIPNIIKSESKNISGEERPFFSIITITYNAEEYIQATMDSVLKQTFRDFEYIIIDGYSNDATLEIIQKNHNNITTWISEPDSGIYDAMNKGISLSKGRWVNFMNAGDTFSDENVLENIAKQIESSTDVVYGDRYYIKDNQKRLQLAKSIDTIFERMPFGHQSTFVRNDVIKKYRFNETYKFSADYDLLIKLYLAKHNFQYINIPICDFIAGGHSESGIRPYLEVLKILLDNTNDKNIIKKNSYFREFKKSSSNILNSFIER